MNIMQFRSIIRAFDSSKTEAKRTRRRSRGGGHDREPGFDVFENGMSLQQCLVENAQEVRMATNMGHQR